MTSLARIGHSAQLVVMRRSPLVITRTEYFDPFVLDTLKNRKPRGTPRHRTGDRVARDVKGGWVESRYVGATTRRELQLSAYKVVNRMKSSGALRWPDHLKCCDCGRRAYEYDHVSGYDIAHCLDVEAVCRRCHTLREDARGVHDWRMRRERDAMGPKAVARLQEPEVLNAIRRAARSRRAVPAIRAAMTACAGCLRRVTRHIAVTTTRLSDWLELYPELLAMERSGLPGKITTHAEGAPVAH